MGTTVFQECDQAALDREYDNRAKVADSAEYLARYTSESAKARRDLESRREWISS